MNDSVDLLNEELAGRYRVERELGQGGMATVYLARDLRHDRQVAIKLFDPELAATIGSERFTREIEIAARLSHPHILPLFDSGGSGQVMYYVMPYVDGGSLRSRLDREGQLPVEDALRLTREVASALGHAHAQGLIHRDIKPENILLADGIALLADFGIALAARSTAPNSLRLTQTGMTLGTPLYMAPEQALGGELDERADLYSLACVLYEMLAGQTPFTGPHAHSIMHQVLSVDPRPVNDFRPNLPGGIGSVLAKALAKTPADRFPSAARFVEALTVSGSTQTVARSIKVEVPHNLPRSRTHFIGREKELAELERLIGDSRLITLTGIGGCGKTRLALKWAEQSLDSYPDGVWFVDLAPVADPDRVPQVVATALSLREEPGVPIVETLLRHLAKARSLVLLDNCEHVLTACVELVDAMLARTSELRVLATSRESLGVDGERAIGVRSLSVPGAAGADLESIRASESVAMFVDRARRVSPDFQLTAANAPAVAEICRRLDGIPLAIEFAAARVEMLSVEQIRSKLDDRFRLLTGGGKALPRQQTLQATIQWSYDHLSPEEQHVFRLLSVFASGWTLPSAAAVVGVDEFEVLDPLTRLVHKSLVIVQREGGQEPRYRMLESVRQYARDKLDEAGETAATRTRHLEFFTAFMADAGPKLVGPEQGEALRHIDAELENLLAAHGWCEHLPDGAARDLKLIADLPLYWTDRGMLEVGLKVFREALARPGADAAPRTRVLSAAGRLAFRAGHYDESEAYAQQSLALARQEGDHERATWALHLLGAVAFSRGALDDARARYEEGLELAQQPRDERALADIYNALAMIRHAQGDLDAAAPLYQESLALKRKLGNTRDVGIVLLNFSQLEIQRGSLDSARRTILESVDYVGESGSRLGARSLLDTAAGLAAGHEDYARAARYFGAADAMLGWTGAPRDPGDDQVMLPIFQRTREALGAPAFEAAHAGGQGLTFEAALGEVRAWLAEGSASLA